MNWYLVLDQIMDDNIGICPAVNHKSSMLSRVVIYLVFPFVFSMCHVSFKLACHIVILVTLYKFFFSFLFFCLFLSLSLFREKKKILLFLNNSYYGNYYLNAHHNLVERISMNHLNVVFEIVDVIPLIGSNVSIRTLEEQVELKHTL